MVEIAKTPIGKSLRYVSSNQQTWFHARDICEILEIKYQTKKFRSLMTRKFKTPNKVFKKVNQLYVLKRDLETLYRKSTEVEAIRWISDTFKVNHIQTKRVKENKYTDFLMDLFNDPIMDPALKQKIKVFIENDFLETAKPIQQPKPKPKPKPSPKPIVRPKNDITKSIYVGGGWLYYIWVDETLYLDMEMLIGLLRIDWPLEVFENDDTFNTRWIEIKKRLRNGPVVLETMMVDYKSLERFSDMAPSHLDKTEIIRKINSLV